MGDVPSGLQRHFGVLFLLRVPRLDLTALVAARLQVEGALVLQPPPVAGDAADLLAVVVGRGVREGGDGGVDAVALDAAEEGGIFLHRH